MDIHSSQKVETALMSIDRGIDKQIWYYTYNGVLAFKRKEILTHAMIWSSLERYYAK